MFLPTESTVPEPSNPWARPVGETEVVVVIVDTHDGECIGLFHRDWVTSAKRSSGAQ